MNPVVALVVVSHSKNLAIGVVEVAAQMAPGVLLLPAGGTDDDGIGTSYSRVLEAVEDARGAGSQVLLLPDLGSATMLAETVVEEYDSGVAVADVPLVEGTIAAAVAAQNGEVLTEVIAAARTAVTGFGVEETAAPEEPPTAQVRQTVTLSNTLGLHARPAAMVARIVGGYDAAVMVNGVDGASVLALMGLALPGGAEVELAASGPQAQEAMMALVPHFEEGFGEE